MRRYAALVKDTFTLIGHEHRWRWWLLAAATVAATGIEAAGAASVFILVSLISGADTATIPVVGSVLERYGTVQDDTLKLVAAGSVAVFFIIRAVFLLLQELLRNRIVHNAVARLSDRLLAAYLTLPYLTHTRRSSSELVRNTYDGTSKLISRVALPVLTVISDVLVVIVLGVTVIVVAPAAVAFTFTVVGVTVAAIQTQVRPRIVRHGQIIETESANAIAAVQQAFGGIRDVKLLEREPLFLDAHRRARVSIARSSYHTAALTRLSPLAIETAIALTIISVFAWTIVAGGGARTLGTLAVFAYAGLRLQPVLQRLTNFANSINSAQAVLENIRSDLAVAEAHRSEGGEEGGPFCGAVELTDVTFTYTDGVGEDAVSGVDLTIRKGEFIGVCGPTGGGKSTLIDLIVGLLTPDSGTVTVDGTTLSTRPAWWWRQIGVVSQNPFLIDDTLERNITFADEGADPERLARCISEAQLDDVVAALPGGLATLVGERGVRLSGGQRQRVALARALYQDPAVLILDEGTSALDGATEKALMDAIDRRDRGRTLIAVAHRIGTIRNADRIVVIADGTVAAEGSYAQLLAASDLFAQLNS
jgi:ATP-binding cassette, subfamily B, bacterial PglK